MLINYVKRTAGGMKMKKKFMTSAPSPQKLHRSIEQYFPVVTFESVDEILKCDHSNESY